MVSLLKKKKRNGIKNCNNTIASATKYKNRTSMYASMVLQIRRCSKGFGAVFANVVFLAGMNSSMNYQRILSCKIFSTIFALKHFGVGVYGRNVILQVTPLTEKSSAVLAFVRLVSGMKSHVNLKIKLMVMSCHDFPNTK